METWIERKEIGKNSVVEAEDIEDTEENSEV